MIVFLFPLYRFNNTNISCNLQFTKEIMLMFCYGNVKAGNQLITIKLRSK